MNFDLYFWYAGAGTSKELATRVRRGDGGAFELGELVAMARQRRLTIYDPQGLQEL